MKKLSGGMQLFQVSAPLQVFFKDFTKLRGKFRTLSKIEMDCFVKIVFNGQFCNFPNFSYFLFLAIKQLAIFAKQSILNI